MNTFSTLILIRGGGDLASGVALRLHRSGFKLLITEHPQPLAVRRLVSFAEAVYRGKFSVEGVKACLVNNLDEVKNVLDKREIPVIVDPDCVEVFSVNSPLPAPLALVDARMTKRRPDLGMNAAPLVIGLGPGFTAGTNCHAAIETNRGHFLGRVIWDGSPEADTGIPGAVNRYQEDRVLRAPADGLFHAKVDIGDPIQKGQVIATVADHIVIAKINGTLRGLLHDGLNVERDIKVGDIDPRSDPRFASVVSDKSLAVGGGVLEALLTCKEIRERLWN